MSDSESDSDKDECRRTKKTVVVKFHFDDSSSEDSDVAGPSNQNQRAKRHKKNALDTSDDSSNDSDTPLNSMQQKCSEKTKTPNCIDESDDDSLSAVEMQQASSSENLQSTIMMSESSDTDSSSDSTEKCPICLHSFREQEIGTPSVCDHSFCAPCIEEWSSNVQTCPIDRKPFTTIRIRSRYTDGVFLREQTVQAKLGDKKEDELDFTRCEVCNHCDREDVMLLCDGCDAGYHMDCLTPPLTEIPDGEWFCNICYADDRHTNPVARILSVMGAYTSAANLRVRGLVPRILRTGQSERIRSTIQNRRQQNQVNVSSVLDTTLPGPSRSTQTFTTTMTTVTSTTTTRRQSNVVKKKVKNRRRKVHRNRRTYVVEYDIDDYDNKFGIKTTSRVIRKRRRKTKKSRKKSRINCGRRNQNVSDSQNLVEGVLGGSSKKGIRQQYPKLHIFGNKNALEYFSGDSDNDVGNDPLNSSMEAGDGLLIMSTSRPRTHQNLMRRKNVTINTTMGMGESEGGSDILSNIMDTMNRWHSMSRPSTIEKIKINADGSLECGPKPSGTPQSTEQPNAEILNAPMNPRNDGSGNRNFNNSNGFRGNNSNRNSGNYSQNRFGDRNEQSPFQQNQRAGNFNESGHGTNIQPDNFSPRNRTPFQRQRSNNSRLLRNQFQAQPHQGLYDGEDIPQITNMPTQSDNDLNSRLKVVQQDSDGIGEASQSSPSVQPQADQNPDCSSNNIQTVSQEQNNTQATGEVSSSHDQPVSTTSGVSSTANYSDSDDGNDCPVFEYSEESMKVAKDSKDSPETTSNEPEQTAEENMENDEDLVQLDDDEHFANETGISEEHVNQTQSEADRAIESPVASPETTNAGAESPDVHSLNNECESNEPTTNEPKITEDLSESEEQVTESSEAQPITDNQTKVKNDKHDNPSIGIEGMDTEMISEDEHELPDEQASKELKADKANNNQKADRDDSFKKVSKSNKERNYRDKKEKSDGKSKSRRSKSRSPFSRSRSRSKSKSRSRSKSKSRSRSRNRNRRGDRRPRRKDNRDKRQEIQRYDVRNVIADRQPRAAKDRYGRDTSRPPRSITPRRGKSRTISRSISPAYARRRSLSRHRSHSRRRRSPSRRSNSIRRRRSISRNRRRRSISRSPVYFSPSRSRSFSRGRVMNGQSRSRSKSRSKSRSRSYTPRPAHSGMYHMQGAYSRSRSKDKKLKKKPNDNKKPAKYRSKKKASGTKKVSPFHSPSRREYSPVDRRRTSRSKSWNERASWNRSISDIPNDAELSWTPPIAHAPENLTVILKNKDPKRSKRDKKRKSEKKKTESLQKKEKRKRTEKQSSPALPSKEVFASGDNILVSVSFNKDKPQQQQQTTIVTLPPTKEQILSKKSSDRNTDLKRSRRRSRDVPRKHRKVDIKPVAIIDLDNSPFKEVTPSPRAVIILSDSDHESDKLNKNPSLSYSMTSNATESISNDKHHSSNDNRDTNIRNSSPPLSPTAESATFELPLGPKTPPEPSHLVKFSISTSTKTKIVRSVVNPLHDDNDDEEEDENGENKESNNENVITSADKVQITGAQNSQKVGPNTPPGPCSPDAYDPFEPTKSASQSPSDSAHENLDEAQTSLTDDGKSSKSVDLSMALITSKASLDAANSLLSSTLGGEDLESDNKNDESIVSPYKDKTVDDGFRDSAVPKSSGIHVFSNVLFTGSKNSQPSQSRSSTLTISNLSTGANSNSVSKQSPMKYNSGSIISKLPLPKMSKPQRHNGNDDNMDIESPYSPGSSDYEDWFEPPQNSPPTGAHSKHSSRQAPKSSGATTSTDKVNIFDDLFGTSSPINKGKSAAKRRPSKHSSSIKDWIAVSKHSTQLSNYKLNEEQVRLLDDVPSSAVELQAKDKFLRKLNRQERVIEEVKLVLKPHYNKKHITKDEYKDIMRKAVPKICHNRTGEINPKKIKKLIEAYVTKFRQRRKLQPLTNAIK